MHPNLFAAASRALALCLALLGAAQAVAAAPACGALAVDNAWVRIVPGAPVSAGYFELSAGGDAAITLEAVTSPQFGRVHMHRSTVDDNGMASMTPVAAVTVKPGETVAFAPGGYHLMMFEPVAGLAAGDSVTLELHCRGFDTPRAITAEARTMPPAGGERMHMGHGN